MRPNGNDSEFLTTEERLVLNIVYANSELERITAIAELVAYQKWLIDGFTNA